MKSSVTWVKKYGTQWAENINTVKVFQLFTKEGKKVAKLIISAINQPADGKYEQITISSLTNDEVDNSTTKVLDDNDPEHIIFLTTVKDPVGV